MAKGLLWHKGLAIRELLLPLIAGHALAPGGTDGCVDPSTVCFVDDDATNCKHVSSVIRGATVIHVHRGRGMETDEFEAVRKWAVGPARLVDEALSSTNGLVVISHNVWYKNATPGRVVAALQPGHFDFCCLQVRFERMPAAAGLMRSGSPCAAALTPGAPLPTAWERS